MSHGLAYLACIVMLMYSQVTQGKYNILIYALNIYIALFIIIINFFFLENIAKENDFEKYKVSIHSK